MNTRRLLCSVWLVVCSAGCGVTADLGEDKEKGPPEAREREHEPPDGSTLPPEAVVMDVPMTEHGVDDMAVAGDYLYLLASALTSDEAPVPRLLRCEKQRCTETTVELRRGSAYVSFSKLSVIGDQIGFFEYVSADGAPCALVSCVAPDCAVLARIGGLRCSQGDPLFELGFVEWAQYEDDAVYRCSLPDCRPAPELVVQGIGASRIFHRGDVRLFVERGRLWRQAGDPPELEALELGSEVRSLGRPSFDDLLLEETGPGSRTLLVGDEWLYSLVDDGCVDGQQACSIARWPLRGYGARELVYSHDAPLGLSAIYDGELVFARPSGQAAAYDKVSCRIEDCSGTLRVLPGDWVDGFVSDAERLYFATVTPNTKVYSLPRLPVP